MSRNEGSPETPVHEAVADALVAGGADLAVYLPDSVLYRLTARLESEPRIRTVVCSREDEGVAIACGASLAGGLPVAVMEGSGVGYCGLILARAQLQRSGFLLIASHSPALGEPHDYHGTSRLAGAGVLRGLGIPFETARSGRELVEFVAQSLLSVRGQRSVIGVLVPPFVMQSSSAA